VDGVDRIHVIATDDVRTRAAIEDAVRRALICRASLIVWIPRLIGEAPGEATLLQRVEEYRTLIADLGDNGRVRVCYCHAPEQLAELAGQSQPF